jgi:hypothetical protein
MRLLTRGIPDFTHLLPMSVIELDWFTSTKHNLHVTHRVSGYTGEYFQAESGKRVSLYVEGVAENESVINSRCFDDSRVSMKMCFVTINPDTRRLKSAGTTSSIRPGVGEWYMVDPRLDPRWPALLQKARDEDAKRAKEQARLQEQEDELREQLLDAASSVGYAEAIRRIQGETAC